jgi:hypothetical protein
MNPLFLTLFSLFSVAAAHYNGTAVSSRSSNQCVTFQVGSGTGCAWMCDYCANQLGTYSYYFTTDICTYQTGGCVGTPLPNTPYTCCSM